MVVSPDAKVMTADELAGLIGLAVERAVAPLAERLDRIEAAQRGEDTEERD